MVLNEYGSAVFIAYSKVGDKYNVKTDCPVIFQGEKTIHNPEYKLWSKEERLERKKLEKERVYNYLKENFPNKDYANKFKKEYID